MLRRMISEKWLSPRRFAVEMGLPQSTVYHYLRKGMIPFRREGQRIWISSFELREFKPPRGIVPERYRGADGRLPRASEVPRSALLWGSVAWNEVLRRTWGEPLDSHESYRY